MINQKLNYQLNLILFLNKNYEITVKSEIIYISHFDNIFSCSDGRIYIILNNASLNDNNYIFISSNKNFSINNIDYNIIDN